MRLPRSTHLPQRATSSPLISLLYVLAYFTSHAFAAKDDSITHENHQHPLLNSALEVDIGPDLERYEPEFAGADRSIIGRAGDPIPTLRNNAPGTLNISQGDRQYWTFPKKTLFGAKSPRTSGLPSYLEGQNVSVTPDDPSEVELYISLTTCWQPLAKNPKPDDAPDQLELYISTSSNKQQPDEKDITVLIEEGFGSLNISVENDVYFGVYAPANEDYDGVYNYQLTASIDGFFASSYNYTNLYFVDSDSNSALLYSRNTTNTTNSSDLNFQQWMDRSLVPAFSLFLQNQQGPSIVGLQRSVCGLQNLAQIQVPQDVGTFTNMTAAGDGLPKQQFHVKNLNRSSTYYAVIAMIGNSTHNGSGVVGGGGTVWANPQNFTTNFTTKSCESFDGYLSLSQSLTEFQSIIAPFFSTCLFVTPLHMQLQRILRPSKRQSFSATTTMNTPKIFTKTFRSRSNRSRVTLQPLLSILLPEHVMIATPLTDSGSAPSPYPDAWISQIRLRTCSPGRSIIHSSTRPTQVRLRGTRCFDPLIAADSLSTVVVT